MILRKGFSSTICFKLSLLPAVDKVVIMTSILVIVISVLVYMTNVLDSTEEVDRKCLCQRRTIRCGNVPDVENGNITGFISDYFGDLAYVICDEGFDVITPVITCQTDGSWSTAVCADQALAGTSYITIFPRATQTTGGNEFCQIYITASEPTNVNIVSPFGPINRNIVVNDFAVEDFPVSFMLDTSNVIRNRVVEVTSDKPINLVTLSYRVTNQLAMDSFLNRPSDQLSTEYVIITTQMAPQYSIASIEDGTVCIITRTSGSTFTRTINRLRVYTFLVDSISRSNDNDLTGTIINCDKPVAVFCGGFFATVPFTDDSTRDLFAVQLIGVPFWSTVCFISPFLPRVAFEYKLVASQDNTTIQITKSGQATNTVVRNRAEKFSEYLELGVPVVFQSDKPILIAQFAVSSGVDNAQQGDGSMVQCLNTDSYLNRYAFFVPDNFDEHQVRVTIQDIFVSQLLLNGSPVPASLLIDDLSVTIPGGDTFSILYIRVFERTNNILTTQNGVRFGADLYGTIRVGMYIHSIGQRYNAVN